MLVLPFFFFLGVDGKHDADRLFFQKRVTHKSFIPANPLNEYATHPLLIFHERMWPIKETRFRLSFNPFRCEAGNNAKNHTMLISLLEDHIPGDPISMEELLLNAIVLTGSKALKNPNRDAALQKFRYSLIQTRNGTKYPEDVPFSGLFFDMYTGHFYVAIERPYLTVYFFDEDAGEVKFRFSIFSSTARFFAFYANYVNNCPLFISVIDSNFPDWVPGKKMAIRRDTDPREKSVSTVSSVFVALVVVAVLTLLTKTFIVPLSVSFILPRIGRPIQTGGMQRKFDYGSDFVDTSNVIGDEPTSPKTAMGGGDLILPSREVLKKLVMSARTRNAKAKKMTHSQKIQKTQNTQLTTQATTQMTTQHVGTTQQEMNEVTGEAAELEEEKTQPDA